MKKTAFFALALLLAISLAGCGNTPATTPSPSAKASSAPSPSPTAKAAGLEFKEENGVLTCLDVKNSPFEKSGLKITLDKSKKTVNFVKTDLEGKSTVEYWLFNYADNTVIKYSYVSAMGTGYYYYYDLTKNEITKLEDKDHADKTESSKQGGRLASATDTLKDEVSKLSSYFKQQFGKNIADAASGK